VQPVDFVTFGVILDDVLFPDGSISMGSLGGGGLQTAFGMRLWSASVGLAARIGTDYQGQILDWLEGARIDHQAVQVSDRPTLRAWQLLEQDGRRTQLWQVDRIENQAQLKYTISDLPERYRHARGYHLGIHPETPDLDFLSALKSLGGLLSVEPFRPAQCQIGQDKLEQLLSVADIFSANQSEASSLVGPAEPAEQALRMVEAGAKVAVIRCAEAGSLAATHQTGVPVHIPAHPTRLANPVGAGNAYCGGFLVGWVESGDLRLAGEYGAVAASLMIENRQLPIPDLNMQSLARSRLKAFRSAPSQDAE
jgi:sugar/nucleoside kinase (ribokinase family)